MAADNTWNENKVKLVHTHTTGVLELLGGAFQSYGVTTKKALFLWLAPISILKVDSAEARLQQIF